MTGPVLPSGHDIEAVIAILVVVTAVCAVFFRRASRRRPQPAPRSRVYLPASRYGSQPGSEVAAMCRHCKARPAEYRGECGICLTRWECRPD